MKLMDYLQEALCENADVVPPKFLNAEQWADAENITYAHATRTLKRLCDKGLAYRILLKVKRHNRLYSVFYYCLRKDFGREQKKAYETLKSREEALAK